MILFCAAFKIDSVSLSRFPFCCHVLVFSRKISPICCLKYQYSCSHFWFLGLVIVLFILRLSVLLLAAVISLVLLLVWMHSHNVQWWWLLFLLHFLTHTVCLCHLSDIRPWAWSSTFLFFGLFAWVSLLSISRMVQSSFQKELPRCLFVWWDFYCRS